MTDTSLDPEIIKQTQESLGKFVKKPPLTEKLLKKPPFKFIHDVIKVVIRDTNFLEELFTDDELNADNIKDREGKMKFLQKLIDVIKIVTKKDLQVKASKIVAGLEAEKTNELFQAIAYALENKLDSKEAVEVVKHSQQNGNESKNKQKASKVEKSKPTKSQPPSRDRTPAKPEPKKVLPAQRSIEKKETTKEKDKASKERSTSKSRAPVEQKKIKKVPSKESSPKLNGEVLTNGSVDSQSSLQSLPQQASVEKKDEPREETAPVVEQNSHNDEANKENEVVKVNGDTHVDPDIEKENSEPPPKPQDEFAAIIDEEAEFRRKEKMSKKLSAKHRQKSVEDAQQSAEQSDVNLKPEKIQSSFKRESLERPRTSLRPPSARPASSRPAAPRRRDKNIEIVLQPDETMKLGDINVKMENFTKELEDDGENLIIIEDSNIISENFLNERLPQSNSEDINEDEQGKLVQQILETEKNFEGALGMEVKKTEIEFDDTKTQTNVKQIEHLKDLIQKLVRSVNPMGKLMDFVQEDIDSMQREYTKWNEIYKQATIDLKKEQIETATAVEPLKYQLNQLEKKIIEHQQSIDQLRGSLVLNEQKIMKMFMDV